MVLVCNGHDFYDGVAIHPTLYNLELVFASSCPLDRFLSLGSSIVDSCWPGFGKECH